MRSTKSMNIERIKDILTLAKEKPTLSQRELAKELGVSRNTVKKALDKVSDFKEEIELFRKQRGDILDEKQALILRAINSKKVSEAKLRDLAVAAGILFDKNRLERGLSTNNIASWLSIVAEAHRRGTEEKGLESAHPMRTDEGPEVEPQ
jgi:DNA-binding transcriptional regulator YhcF (GntR family)